MKNYLIVTLLMISVIGFSQKNSGDSISIKKTKLKEVKFLHELVKNFPKDCKSISISIVAKVDDKIREANCQGDELSESVKDILNKADANTKIFIDWKTVCPKVENHGLKIIATE